MKTSGHSIEELKATIAQQENELIEAMRTGDLPLVEGGGGLRADNLKTLQMQRNDAQLEVERLQAMYNAAISASEKGDILAIVGENKAIQNARTANLNRIADLEKRNEEIERRVDEKQQKRKELLVTYTDEHPSIKKIDAEIAELSVQKVRINREVSEKITSEGKNLEQNAVREVLASLRSQLDASQQRLGRSIAAFDNSAARANVEGIAETKLTTLKSEIKSNHDLLDTYTQRQKEQELALSTGRPNKYLGSKSSNDADAADRPAAGSKYTRRVVPVFCRRHRPRIFAGLS